MDPILTSWGATGDPFDDLPPQPGGILGQVELGGELLSWGSTAEPGGFAVPEPAGLSALAMGGIGIWRRRSR